MNDKKKIIIFLAGFTALAKLISLAIGIAMYEVVGKALFLEQAESHMATSNTIAGFQMHWPWYYYAVIAIAFSVYWYWVGRVAYRKLGHPNWRYSLLVAPLYFLLSFDLLFPVYALVSATGGMGVYGKSRK